MTMDGEDFLRRPIYLLGNNAHSASLIDALAVDGVIDDFAPGGEVNGIPVVHGDEVPRHAIVVNCVFQRCRTAETRMRRHGCASVLTYSEVMWLVPDRIPVPDFVADARREIPAHRAEISALRARLADSESRAVLDGVLALRASADYRCITGLDRPPAEQYFDPIMAYRAGDVICDIGGFDGDTARLFAQHCPEHTAIHVFEPDPANLARARERLADHSRTVLHDVALGAETGTIAFEAGAGSASAPRSEAVSSVPVDTLDRRVPGAVSVLKLDIEGAETSALLGASEHIRRDQPRIAVAVYHEMADFWRIAKTVLDIRDDYDVYLRHYTEGRTETIMYFVPTPSS